MIFSFIIAGVFSAEPFDTSVKYLIKTLILCSILKNGVICQN